jgi:predicted negative regulator of RcsB-dependent stress response
MLIQSYTQDSLSLTSYAHSELLVFQRRLSEAAEKLYQLAQENKSISALAGRKAAHLLLQLEKVTDARELLLKILQPNWSPWDIELSGSQWVDDLELTVLGTMNNPVRYTNALNNNNPGINLEGLDPYIILEMREKGIL